MLNNISWFSYWATCALMTIGYYLVIIPVYFTEEIRLVLSKTSNQTFSKLDIKSMSTDWKSEAEGSFVLEGHSNESSNDFKTPEKDSLEYIVYACIDEFTAYLEQSRKSKCSKSNLIEALHAILQKYPTIRNSEYQVSLSNVLIAHCENICSVRLSEEDLVKMWSK